jgi:hypothetical protein
MARSIDIANQQFGRLTAICMTARGSMGPPRQVEKWMFRCDCNREIEAIKGNVTSGKTTSCGCLHRERASEVKTTHGHTAGQKRSSEYSSWIDMRKRCRNPNSKSYSDYGGRGITVCERWKSFENFLADMGSKPSPEYEIDRIDNDGPYSPENCQWATRVEQQNNTRKNRFFTIGGQNRTIAEHAREASIDPDKLRRRIEAGWSPEILAALLRIYRERADPLRGG